MHDITAAEGVLLCLHCSGTLKRVSMNRCWLKDTVISLFPYFFPPIPLLHKGRDSQILQHVLNHRLRASFSRCLQKDIWVLQEADQAAFTHSSCTFSLFHP